MTTTTDRDRTELMEDIEGQLAMANATLRRVRDLMDAIVRHGFINRTTGEIESRINPRLLDAVIDGLGLFLPARPIAAPTEPKPIRACATALIDIASSRDGEGSGAVSSGHDLV